MAKTLIEDLRPKGSRFFENLATGNTPIDLYTGKDMSGRLISTGPADATTGVATNPLTIPIKNKRGKRVEIYLILGK